MTNCNYSEHTKIQRKEIEKQIEELQAKLEELEKQEPQTLYEICMDWWRDLYSTADMNISIEKLVNRIEKEWLPDAVDDVQDDWDDGYNAYHDTLMENLK